MEFQDLSSQLGDVSSICLPAGLPGFLAEVLVSQVCSIRRAGLCLVLSHVHIQEGEVAIKTQMETGECWQCFVTSRASFVPMGSRCQAIPQRICKDPSLPPTQDDSAQWHDDAVHCGIVGSLTVVPQKEVFHDIVP